MANKKASHSGNSSLYQPASGTSASGKKKGGGGKAIAALLIIAILVGGAAYLYKCTPVFDSFKQYKAEYDAASSSDEAGDGEGYVPDAVDAADEADGPHTVDDSADTGLFKEQLGGIFSSCQGAQTDDPAAADRLIVTSASDEQENIRWQESETDEAYRSLMTVKIDEIITLITQLDDLRGELTDCKSPSQVESNEQYASLKRQINGWCNGAQEYSVAELGESSRDACTAASDIASDARSYLALYPQMVCGDESAEQNASALLQQIVSKIFALQEIINSAEN